MCSRAQARLLSDVRTELASLGQRHAALASSSAADQRAAAHASGQLRSSLETQTMQLEQVQRGAAALGAEAEGAKMGTEKLKKLAKRHELALTRMTEIHEARYAEVRGLLKLVAAEVKPLATSVRTHGSQARTRRVARPSGRQRPHRDNDRSRTWPDRGFARADRRDVGRAQHHGRPATPPHGAGRADADEVRREVNETGRARRAGAPRRLPAPGLRRRVQ